MFALERLYDVFATLVFFNLEDAPPNIGSGKNNMLHNDIQQMIFQDLRDYNNSSLKNVVSAISEPQKPTYDVQDPCAKNVFRL